MYGGVINNGHGLHRFSLPNCLGSHNLKTQYVVSTDQSDI